MPDTQPSGGRLIQSGDFGPVRTKWRYRKPATESLAEIGDSIGAFFRRPLVKRVSLALLCLTLAGGGVWAYFHFRTPPIPDIAEDDIDDVLDYTLLTDEFNKLSIDDRLKIIKELVSRMKGMDGDDSALMAAFMAGISGKAREQLMKNADKLAIDVWDMYAMEYERVPAKERDAYLDDAFIRFTKTMEDIAGVSRDISDTQRLAEAKTQAKRDADRMAKRQEAVRGDRVAGFFDLMQKRGSKETTPVQRGRMTRFAQDMTRHLRNQDVDTGKPKDAAAPTQPSTPAAPPPAENP